ncbi:MAG: ornithine aminomutase subunit alpha [Clostridia bacterium]
MKRVDNYEEQRAHLNDMTEEQLKDYFWSLTDKLIEPLIDLGKENTSPAIERSVLLRMGFSSLEAKAIVDNCMKNALMGHGAGNVVYKTSKHLNKDLRETGLQLADGKLWDIAVTLF